MHTTSNNSTAIHNGTLKSNVNNLEKLLLLSVVSLQKRLTHFYCRNTYSIYLNITLLKLEKTTISSTTFLRLKFQGYRCESGIAIFAYRVT